MLASVSQDFSISYTPSLSTCNSFRLRIARTDETVCATAWNNFVPSNDSTVQAYVAETLGPDSFLVTADGPERMVLESPSYFDEASCAYEFDVRMVATGLVSLEVVWLHTDYNGFFEEAPTSNATHIIQRLARPLLNPIPLLDTCGDSCSKKSYESRLRIPEFAPSSPATRLPPCTGPRPIAGSYLPSDSPSLPHPPPHLPLSRNPPSYEFVPTSCEFRHDGLRFRDHAACLSSRHVALLIGDSHARILHEELIHRLEGNNGVLEKGIGKFDSGTVSIGNVDIAFHWNPYLKGTWDCAFIDGMDGVDSVTISWGAHPAAWQCISTADFRKELSAYFREIQDAVRSCYRAPGRPAPRFIQMTTPAWAAQVDGSDCRTGQRLEYWNAISTELADKMGWSTIDFFTKTRPFVPDSVDAVHFVGTSAMVPVVDEAIEKMGLCPIS